MQSTSIHSTGLYRGALLGHSSHFRSGVILYWFTWVFSGGGRDSGLGSCTVLGRVLWEDALSSIYPDGEKHLTLYYASFVIGRVAQAINSKTSGRAAHPLEFGFSKILNALL
jgi:hypothetical protein